jgi:hypothetical protein
MEHASFLYQAGSGAERKSTGCMGDRKVTHTTSRKCTHTTSRKKKHKASRK